MSGWMRELERLEDGVKIAEATQPYDPGAFADAYRRLVDAAERRTEIAGICGLSQLYDELSEAYENDGRYEDALTAMEQAIAAGYQGEPDARCRLAELHLRFGHPEPAHAIFAQVRTETPDDVWLYNNAGLDYHHSGDHERALGWLDEGLELAMRAGDPEGLVGQLQVVRQECLDALGRPTDDLQRRATEFEPSARRRTPTWSVARPEPSAEPWSVPLPEGGARRTLGFAWFPSGDFPLARERWPALVDGWEDWDFGEYCRETQRRVLRHAAGPDGPRLSIKVVPIVLSTYLPWCEERGEDPGAGPTRWSYAGELLETAAADLVAWPPARNGRCWCGSGRKYKQCCGTARLTPDES